MINLQIKGILIISHDIISFFFIIILCDIKLSEAQSFKKTIKVSINWVDQFYIT